MRKITKFPKLVIDEAKNLRKFATKGEKANLDFDRFNDNSAHGCIYGQLTGYCHSPRAIELITLSAKRVYIPKYHKSLFTNALNVENPGASTKLNGKPKIVDRREEITYWSPIEVFVNRENTPEAMKKQLLEYIKGKKRKLE